MWKQIKRHPMHMTLGVGLIMIGLWLICNDHFFPWPPAAVEFVNDDIWGFSFLLVGIGHLIWVCDGANSIRWNGILLTISGGLMGVLTIYQLLIWINTGHYMSWISNLIITAFVLILARRSDTKNE